MINYNIEFCANLFFERKGVSLCKERRIKRLIFGLIIVKVRKTLKNYKKIIKKKKSKNMSVLYA